MVIGGIKQLKRRSGGWRDSSGDKRRFDAVKKRFRVILKSLEWLRVTIKGF
jgi:hypothetical protein